MAKNGSNDIKEVLRTKSENLSSKVLSTYNKDELTNMEVKQRALLIAVGLTSTEHPNNYTGWYCKAFKTLGEQKYAAIASMARDGKNPKTLFPWLLKQELERVK